MRILATIALSFAAGIFAAVLLPWQGWQLIAGIVFAVCGVAFLILKRCFPQRSKWWLRLILITFSLAVSLFYFTVYRAVKVTPVLEQCGKSGEFCATLTDYPVETERGGKVSVRLSGGTRAVYYGEEEILTLEPGQKITGKAYWQDAARIHEREVSVFASRGIRVLLYGRGEAETEEGSKGSALWLPVRVRRAAQEMIGKIWEKDSTTASFICAMLTGDRHAMAEEDAVAMSEAGLSHLFAVSGLHCTFLLALLGLLLPKSRRRLFAGVSIAVLLFYMMAAGMSPSVVRASVMLIFLLLAPLLRRDRDGLTAWSAALMALLLVNPYAAASISLQLSFAAAGGLLLCSGRLYQWMMKLPAGGIWRSIWSFLAANLSSSLGALIFTVPLVGFHFNILTLISPISNLLVLPAAGWAFMLSFILVIVGFVWLPAAQAGGWLVWGLVHYAIAVARWLMRLPYHALYFSNRYLKYWLLYFYTLLGVCIFTGKGRRKAILTGVLASATLILTVYLGAADFHGGELQVMALDVGQGASVLLNSEESAMLVDCGSSNSYIDAGGVAADQISSMGIPRLTAVAVSHYHADHINGLVELMARIPVDTLYLPRIEEENEARDRLISLAEQYGTDVVCVDTLQENPLGRSRVRIYPPLGRAGDNLNEQGLSVLCSAGDFDVLITGDMDAETERSLTETYELPDIEALLVSHHGARSGSCEELLEITKPETAVISVGDNSYGHPAYESMARLQQAGAEIYRTDLSGNIWITVHKGE